MINNLEVLNAETIPNRVHELSDEGYRFVTMTCCSNKDGTFDIFYSFDKELKLANLKMTVPPNTGVQSISQTYLCAAFVENEISELFGIPFTGLAIDYGGKFILSEGAPDAPFGRGIVIVNKDGETHA